MANLINEEDRNRLYTKVLHRLGAPIRAIELEREQLDSLLEIAVEDYSELLNNWLTESQWGSLAGLDLDIQDVQKKLMTRDLNFVRQFTYAYSKQVGLNASGTYELKKDYITLVKNQQAYVIPANREINEVLWFTPPSLDQSIVDPFLGMWGMEFGGMGMGTAQVGMGSYYVMPSFDILLRLQDRNLKNRILRSEFTYKITGGPNGTKILHLLNVPGGKYDFNSNRFYDGKVWYMYYDVADKDRDACLAENKDIIRLPSDVPLDNLIYEDLNDQSKTWIRRYFTALSKETLGRTRGKFSGKLKIPDDELTLDYESLLNESKSEIEDLKKEVMDRLERMRNDVMLKRKAEEGESLNKALSYIPFKNPYNVI
jgi:hypothetical protein